MSGSECLELFAHGPFPRAIHGVREDEPPVAPVTIMGRGESAPGVDRRGFRWKTHEVVKIVPD
jgi:hypothetical protein